MANWGRMQITRTGIVFVIGIIVLIALVLGGIWLVRERGEQARRQEAVKIAEANLENQSQTSAETKTNTETTSTPTTTETPAQTETTTVATAASTADLPETGVELSHILIISLLTLAISYYLTSRRALKRL